LNGKTFHPAHALYGVSLIVDLTATPRRVFACTRKKRSLQVVFNGQDMTMSRACGAHT
jgi:hypothetical protein